MTSWKVCELIPSHVEGHRIRVTKIAADDSGRLVGQEGTAVRLYVGLAHLIVAWDHPAPRPIVLTRDDELQILEMP